MTPYQRLFGAAPIAWASSLALLWIAFLLRPLLPPSALYHDSRSGIFVLLVLGAAALALSIWTHLSLPPWFRGRRLVTRGAFRYIRHPLYASFLLFLFGFAYWLNHWVFLLWAVVQLPVWHFSAVHEEKLMRMDYPAYDDYCQRSHRFIPGLW